MSSEFTYPFANNFKPTQAKHRKWSCNVFADGESWPIVSGNVVNSSSDIYLLGIRPTYSLGAISTAASGTSTANTYGICIVYRSTLFQDGLTAEDIQSNRSNIQDVTLTSAQAASFTRVVSTDTKVNYIDVYAAVKTNGVYGPFYLCVDSVPNSAGSLSFNPLWANDYLTGTTPSAGNANATATILDDTNDAPVAQPIVREVGGRCVSLGGRVITALGTFTNGSPTVTFSDTIYNGIDFWFIHRTSDSAGGINARGTYLIRYATSTTGTLVDETGTSVNYSGTSGTELCTIWTPPNRRWSKLFNPHAYPEDGVNDDYRSAILAGDVVPNTTRLLVMGVDWVVAEDYNPTPADGINYLSTERGCSSPFSVVAAEGRLFWFDLGNNNREICYSDGTTVSTISTQKIQSILNQITLDSNGEAWRIGFIHGAYYKNEKIIRWGIYLNNAIVATYQLELDLVTMDVRGDPTFFFHRGMDHFTYGAIRGRVFVGQLGWSGGTALLGVDNVYQRYRDWVPDSALISGAVNEAASTTTVITIESGTFTADAYKGMQVLLWRENDTTTPTILDANPTYYFCRISSNTTTTFTINYVETCNSMGTITAVGTALPSIPSGAGWQYRIGVIQAIIGPKWFSSKDLVTQDTFLELSVIHNKQNLEDATAPIRLAGYENFAATATDAQYLTMSNTGLQPGSSGLLFASSFGWPKTNPADILGFVLTDNNVNSDTYALNVEAIVLKFNPAQQQGN